MFGKFKFRIFALTAILLVVSSGLLFYQKLFIKELAPKISSSNFDIEELHYLDLEINNEMLLMRNNLNTSSDELLKKKNRIKELLNVILDIHQDNEDLKSAYRLINIHFENKVDDIDTYIKIVSDLSNEIKTLNKNYLDIQKANIKFSLDGKDFYRECIQDTLTYLIMPSKDVDWRLNEDIKILSQILGFSKGPNPIVEKYYHQLINIKKYDNEIDTIFSKNKEKKITPQINVILKYNSEEKMTTEGKGQKFLISIFVLIVIYVGALIFTLKN
jgi:hypothetical protein